MKSCRSKIRIFALIPLILAGCANTANIGKWQADDVIDTDWSRRSIISLINGGPTAPNNDKVFTQEELDKAISDIPDSKYTTIRNDIISELRKQSGALCLDYKLSLMRHGARANFNLGATSLLLGSIGAISTNVDVARGLAGGAAFSTGLRSEVNQDFFYNQTSQVFIKAIDKRQQAQLASITAKRELGKDAYSIRDALADIQELHASCSLAGALSSIENAVERLDVAQSITEANNLAQKTLELQSTLKKAADSNKKTPPN